MKMFGSMTGCDLKKMVEGATAQLEKHKLPGTIMIAVPADTLVALYHDYQDALFKHMYYEIGRSLQLEENRDEIRKKIPISYLDDFEQGVKDRTLVESAEEKCRHCDKLKLFRFTPRGRLIKKKKENENAHRQQEYQV